MDVEIVSVKRAWRSSSIIWRSYWSGRCAEVVNCGSSWRVHGSRRRTSNISLQSPHFRVAFPEHDAFPRMSTTRRKATITLKLPCFHFQVTFVFHVVYASPCKPRSRLSVQFLLQFWFLWIRKIEAVSRDFFAILSTSYRSSSLLNCTRCRILCIWTISFYTELLDILSCSIFKC